LEADRFWKIVERAAKRGKGDQDEMLEALSEELGKLESDDVRGFQLRMDALIAEARTWDLWGAAYVMNGGCSDDGFEYFRAWLIAQGREVFEAALRDPETLASAKLRYALDDGYDFEGLLYVATQVYEEMTGEELDGGEDPVASATAEPTGKPWVEHELDQRFPRLVAKFGA
jgi:hypothetical protein